MFSIRARRPRLALMLVALLASGCPSSQSHTTSLHDLSDPDTVRYRLRLRHNPVSPEEAFRCYGHCQAERTPGDEFGL